MLCISHQYSANTVFVAEIVNGTGADYVLFIGTNEQNSIVISADFIRERSFVTGDVILNCLISIIICSITL